MAISNELLMAILAMDSYNRGYNPGITDSGIAALGLQGSQLGNVTLGLARSIESSSFFAQAYTLANGQTVISYRGTDQPLRDRDDRYASSAASEMATVKRRDNGAPHPDRPTVD